MKRVKIMLTSVAIVAVVGGALAFKAQKFSTKFCVNSTTTEPLTEFIQASTFGSAGQQYYYTTEKANGAAITQAADCTSGLVAAPQSLTITVE